MDNGANYLSDNLTQHVKGGPLMEIKVLKIVYSSSVPYYLCIWFIKGAIIGFYYRLIPKQTKSRIFLHFTAICTSITLIVILCLNLFLCRPISRNWALPEFDQHCYSSTARTPFAISSVANLVTDILIFIVPFSIIPSMGSMPRRQLVGLIATFSLGIITMVVFVARAVLSAVSGLVTVGGLLSAVECCTAMIVACLPSLKILLRINKPGGPLPKRGSDFSDGLDSLDDGHHGHHNRPNVLDEEHNSFPGTFLGLEHYEDRARHHHDMMILSTSSATAGHQHDLYSRQSLSEMASKSALRGSERMSEILHPSDDDDDDVSLDYGDVDSSYIDYPAGKLGRSNSTASKLPRNDVVELDILNTHNHEDTMTSMLSSLSSQNNNTSNDNNNTINSITNSTIRSPTPNSQLALLGDPSKLPTLPPLPNSLATNMKSPGMTLDQHHQLSNAHLQQQIQRLQWQQELIQQQQYHYQHLQQLQLQGQLTANNDLMNFNNSEPLPALPTFGDSTSNASNSGSSNNLNNIALSNSNDNNEALSSSTSGAAPNPFIPDYILTEALPRPKPE
ncbi:hypothetical protein D0Z00_002047 [Geotrichum galactomycetum]|uniref:Uncharacterized protein n=1 Tax=Geotrichum galactomycetum TaxID=27317 RepID=A0ACB6V583_9ASCO|nr:hypothetical protein D0Z00_002047 [Geotrichum candidum]